MHARDPLDSLNRLFAQALLRMGDTGETDAACPLAAQGWSLPRHERPKEAERLNGVMHNLTSPRRSSRKESSAGDSDIPALSIHHATRKEVQS